MEQTRRRGHGPRRRGSASRGVDGRLLRNVAIVLLAPVLLLMFTTTRTGPLPAPELPPAFGAAGALRLTTELARDYPDRTPGSAGAARAVRWYEDRVGLYGLAVREDRWREDVPGLGETDLVNLVTVVPGVKDDTILVVAHRDNKGASAGANDNASGTAALVELLRSYAVAGEPARRLEPAHTLVFVSIDAGAYGALGARRLATTSSLAGRAVAVLSLDGLAGRAEPRLELSGPVTGSPAPSLVRTATVRTAEQLGGGPASPDVLTQLVDLALPFGYGEQAAFLAAGRSAVRLTTAPDVSTGDTDRIEQLDGERLGQLGRAAETTLTSLDAAIQLSGRTAPFLYVGDRVVRGWAVQLLLLTALLPFAAVVIDLLVRALRRGTRLAPPWRGLRLRLAAWLALGVVGLVAAAAGVLPFTGLEPPVADAPPIDPARVTGLLVAAGVVVAGWLALRHRRPASRPEHDLLAGYTVAYVALAVVAGIVAVTSPFALLFVLPSLYAWLALPALRGGRAWAADLAFGVGLLGPALGLVVLAQQLGLGARAPLYAAGLASSGTIPWLLSACALAWAAIATYVATLVTAAREPGIS